MKLLLVILGLSLSPLSHAAVTDRFTCIYSFFIPTYPTDTDVVLSHFTGDLKHSFTVTRKLDDKSNKLLHPDDTSRHYYGEDILKLKDAYGKDAHISFHYSIFEVRDRQKKVIRRYQHNMFSYSLQGAMAFSGSQGGGFAFSIDRYRLIPHGHLFDSTAKLSYKSGLQIIEPPGQSSRISLQCTHLGTEETEE